MKGARRVSLFDDGGGLAVRIPEEFESAFCGGEALLRHEHGRLVIEPVHRGGDLVELLDSWDPLDEAFPDTDDADPSPPDVPDLGR